MWRQFSRCLTHLSSASTSTSSSSSSCNIVTFIQHNNQQLLIIDNSKMYLSASKTAGHKPKQQQKENSASKLRKIINEKSGGTASSFHQCMSSLEQTQQPFKPNGCKNCWIVFHFSSFFLLSCFYFLKLAMKMLENEKSKR